MITPPTINPAPEQERFQDEAAKPGAPEQRDIPVDRARLSRSPRLCLPAQYYESVNSPRIRRRRRALLAGVAVGLFVSTALASHWIRTRQDVPLRIVSEPLKDVVVTLKVVPPHAKIRLDGEPIGPPDKNGILHLSIAGDDAANKWLEVFAKGYQPIKRPVTVFAGAADATISLVQLQAPEVELAVNSQPPGADIFLNGVLRGQSPALIKADPREPMTLLLKRQGFADCAKEITAPASQDRVELNLQLTPLSTFVNVVTDPPGAEIVAGGKAMGVSPLRASIDIHNKPELEIVARKPGYEQARKVMTISRETVVDELRAEMVLAPIPIMVRIATTPPDGRITVDGRDLGVSPVVASFDRSQAGQKVTLSAARGNSYRGQLEFTVPELTSAEPRDAGNAVRIPMEFSGNRLTFIFCPKAPNRREFTNLLRSFVEQIHSLSGDQQFTIISAADDRVLIWPEDATSQAGTPEQKLRACDMIRAIRPARAVQLSAALQQAMSMNPSALHIFTADGLNRAELVQFGEAFSADQVAVHIHSTIKSEQDDWLASWSERHRGSFTLMGKSTAPILAAGREEE